MYEGPAPRRGPETPTEWVIFSVFLLVFLTLFAAVVFADYHPARLTIPLVVLFWIPLLALHEAGHAAAAGLLGWRVGRIVVGVGAVIAQFRVGTAAVEVRLVPVEGFVLCVPRRLRLPRLESALIYLAGPAVELFLAAGVFLLAGPDRILSRSEEYVLVVWRSLVIAAAAQAAFNLLPFAVDSRGRTLPSDGLGIVLSFFRPTSYYAGLRDWADSVALHEYDPHGPAPAAASLPHDRLDPTGLGFNRASAESRLPVDGLRFVSDALASAPRFIPRAEAGEHITGRELCAAAAAFARERFGPEALTILADWGLVTGADVGRAVAALVGCGLMEASAENGPVAFRGVGRLADLAAASPPHHRGAADTSRDPW